MQVGQSRPVSRYWLVNPSWVRIPSYLPHFELLAQLEERLTLNQQAVGSTPTELTYLLGP